MTELIYDQQMIISYIKMISEIDSRSKSNMKRLDNIENLVDVVHEMNSNIRVIAEQIRQQGGELKTLVETLKVHEQKIENIEDKMETKDSVSKLNEQVDELRIKDMKKAEKLFNQIKWLLISLLLSGAFYLIWERAIQ